MHEVFHFLNKQISKACVVCNTLTVSLAIRKLSICAYTQTYEIFVYTSSSKLTTAILFSSPPRDLWISNTGDKIPHLISQSCCWWRSLFSSYVQLTLQQLCAINILWRRMHFSLMEWEKIISHLLEVGRGWILLSATSCNFIRKRKINPYHWRELNQQARAFKRTYKEIHVPSLTT